jgi:VanZ family protein
MEVPVKKRLLLWLPPLLYMAAIYHFSSESNPLPELTTHIWDKALHTTEYAGLALLVCRALVGEGAGWVISIAIAVIVASVYGGTDEFHQSFVPGRDSSIFDWMADTTGSTVGAAAYVAFMSAWGGRPLAATRAAQGRTEVLRHTE